MNINVYYGGRGMIDDSTLYILNIMQAVLEELRVKVNRYNLHELKNTIVSLPQTLKEADGVVLATTVEWIGINGWMKTFLDACWFYGDKEKISKTYMVPVVTSTTYGEREAQLDLVNAWEMLGGKSVRGICAYVEDSLTFEMDAKNKTIIEKATEDLYRSISQKMSVLPSSTYAIKQNILKESIDYTPQESEQLSKYASNDNYIKKQKEDIEELAGFYKNILEKQKESPKQEDYIATLKRRYVSKKGLKASYAFEIEGKKTPLILEIDEAGLECYYGQKEGVDVTAKLSKKIFEEILEGRASFQGSFMKGDMTAKGDFSMLRMLDQLFPNL